MNLELFKDCTCCKQTKPTTAFRPHPTTKDRLTYFCQECLSEKAAVKYRKNEVFRNKTREAAKKWYKNNKNKANENKRRYTESLSKMGKIIQRHIVMVNEKIKKPNSYFSDSFSCTSIQLKEHLESLFLPNMDWSNRIKWRIRGKIPFLKFDLDNLSERRKAFHFTNLIIEWRTGCN